MLSQSVNIPPNMFFHWINQIGVGVCDLMLTTQFLWGVVFVILLPDTAISLLYGCTLGFLGKFIKDILIDFEVNNIIINVVFPVIFIVGWLLFMRLYKL